MLRHPKNPLVRQLVVLAVLVLLFVGISTLLSRGAAYDSALPELAVEPFNELLPRSEPAQLTIPKIGVSASFVSLGVDKNLEIEIPSTFDKVGWYRHGPTPGELGPAVILGHVDSKTGPAVFYSLGQLTKGDRIEIDREDGSTAVFEVEMVERYPQSDFPTSLVYGDIDHAGLRLITCSGSYDRDLNRYDHNLIVYATLVE